MKLTWQNYNTTQSIEVDHDDVNAEEMGDAIFDLLVGEWSPGTVGLIGERIAERARAWAHRPGDT